MSRSKLARFFVLLVAISLILTACGKAAETEEAPAQAEEPTEAPEVAPTEKPATTRTGGWMDEIIFTSIDEAPNAIAQIQAGALDIYSYFVDDPDSFQTVVSDPNLTYTNAYGSMDYMLFNVTGPTFNDGRLNPFSNAKIREATNWMIDRDYLVQEAVGGLGAPKTVVLIQAYPDYALYADLIRPLEEKYAYNFGKAESVISSEMEGMGAVKADGKWTFNGKPVVLIGLIRSEDERETIGNYFADQLEKMGFTIDRQVRTRDELAPIWQQSVTAEGEWHWYTGGGGYQAVVRNAGNFFRDFYTSQAATTTAEEAFRPDEELEQLARDLANNTYSSMEERREMFARALTLSLEYSSNVFVLANYSFFPQRADLQIASDLGGGICGSNLWPYTARWEGQEGGTLRSAMSGVLTGPWNGPAGANWFQEFMLQRATTDDAVVPSPYTGLFYPQRLERAEIQAVQGTPMQKTLDWIDLEFVDQIDVPGDAWADWDAANQKFVSVAEKYPDGITARTKTTVYYPSSLWDVKWHDGSTLSIGDFVNYIIFNFDNGKPESAVYDESNVSTIDSFLSHFKGVRIVSTDPLVIETYDDLAETDAEVQLSYTTIKWFPVTQWGPIAWHSYVPGYLAEANRELAFSASKSTSLNVEWTHYVDGPSLEILKKYLDQAKAESYLPFAPTLSDYITPDEIAARYENLEKFYETYNHFWIGTGPYFITQVNSVEGSVVAKRFADFPDPSDKWDIFGKPMIAVVDVSGEPQVTIGNEAMFEAYVSFEDKPYPEAELDKVTYLVYDTSNALIASGEAAAAGEGRFQVVLSTDITSKLLPGASKIEFIAVSKQVSLPTFAEKQFLAVEP